MIFSSTAKPLGVAFACVVLAGCVTTSESSAGRHCVDATRPTYGFEVESNTSVVVTSAPSRRYRVTLAEPCDELMRAGGVGFSNSPSRMVGRGRDGMPVWANAIQGSPMICGRAGDRLTIRGTFSGFDAPQPSCRIARVERLEHP